MEEHTVASDNQITGIFKQINSEILPATTLAESVPMEQIYLSQRGRQLVEIPAADRSAEQNQWLNREVLEAGLAGILLTEDVHRPHY